MTTTDVMIGAAIAVIAIRQVRAAFREQLHSESPAARDVARIVASAASGTAIGAAGAAGVVLTKAGAEDAPRRKWAGWGHRTAWFASVVPRLVFLVWLYDVTDGAAFSPFSFVPGMLGSSMWQPVVTVLGLTEVVGRAGALVVRAVRGRTARAPR